MGLSALLYSAVDVSVCRCVSVSVCRLVVGVSVCRLVVGTASKRKRPETNTLPFQIHRPYRLRPTWRIHNPGRDPKLSPTEIGSNPTEVLHPRYLTRQRYPIPEIYCSPANLYGVHVLQCEYASGSPSQFMFGCDFCGAHWATYCAELVRPVSFACNKL